MGFKGFQKGYTPKYWSETGKFQKEMNILTKELVPVFGAASTREGELIRAINNFYYERFNNGHCNSRARESALISRFLSTRLDAPVNSLTLATNDETLDRIVDYIAEYVWAKRLPKVKIEVNPDPQCYGI